MARAIEISTDARIAARGRVALLLIVVVGLCMTWVRAAWPQEAPPALQRIRVSSNWAARSSLDALREEFVRTREAVEFACAPADNKVICRRLAHGELDAGIVSGLSADKTGGALSAKCRAYPLGRMAVAVVVHVKNPLRHVALEEFGRVFRGATASWRDVGPGRATGAIELYSPSLSKAESYLFQVKAMQGARFAPSLWDLSVKPLRQKLTPDEVAGAVAANPKGVGFLAVPIHPKLDDRVRVVALSRVPGEPPVSLTPSTVADGTYPLADTQVLFVSAEAPTPAHEFADFATGPEGAEILKRHGLWPEYELKKVRGEMRLKEMHAGKGTPVAVCGLAGREELVKALAVEYVKAKALVQVKYDGRATAEEAERAFGETGEVLVAEGVVRGQSSVVRGQLSVAGGAKQLTTDHGQLTTHPLGHRAVGVIVHRDSAVKELTLDDLRQIYSGQIDAWPGASGKDAKMRLIGLAAESAAMRVLAQVVRGPLSVVSGKTEGGGQKAEGGRHARITRRDDTVKVVQAVANEPGAIGFVDVAAMPEKESSVKLVAILADGAKKTAAPTPENLPDGYPLAQPVTLHVHARASDVAKDFAAFVAAHGPEVQQALRASGIVPEKVGIGQSAVGSEGSGGQKADGGGLRAEGLGAVALGQFDEDEGGGEKAGQAALTPGPSPASGRGERQAPGPSSEVRREQKAAAPAQSESGTRAPETASPAESLSSDAQAAADPRLVLGAVLVAAAAAAGFFALRLARR